MRALIVGILLLAGCGEGTGPSPQCANVLRFPDGGVMFPGSINPNPWDKPTECAQ